MAKYQILAKKYRPQIFCDVLGQETIVTTLKNALSLNRISHAYLFCGSRGTGKTTLARIFAKALNCRSLNEESEPCNQCHSCREITGGHSLDVLEIDGASNRGIDDIRNLNETIGYAPASGKYKIYIIDEVHMLTKEAFNALLKTLEEPPENVKFFFATTEPNRVLPTILSRCQRFDFQRISKEKIAQKLKEISQDLSLEIDEEALHLLARLAEGSLRDAESLLDQVMCFHAQPITYEIVAKAIGLSPKDTLFRLDQAIHQSNLSFAFSLSEQLFSEGIHLPHFLEDLTEHYRNLIAYKLGTPLHLTQSERQAYKESAALYSLEECMNILDFLTKHLEKTHKTTFKKIHLEVILFYLLRIKKQVTIPNLLERLAKLASNLPRQDSPPITPQQAENSNQHPEDTPSLAEENSSPPSEIKAPKEESTSLQKEETQNEEELDAIDHDEKLKKQIQYERLLHFTAVELDGRFIKKGSI